MIDSFLKMFSYPFMLRAFAVGIPVVICAALLGVNLVLKRCSMIGDGLSHVSFAAIAIAASLGVMPLYIALPTALIAAFILLKISGNGKIDGDAVIALISVSSLAAGVMVVSLTHAGNVDLNGYMFGSIIALKKEDMPLSIVLSVVIIALWCIFYSRLFAVTFDENFARGCGMNTGLYSTFFAVSVAVTVVLGMHLMGALLISALLVFPPLTSMQVFRSYRAVVISSVIVSLFCFVIGLTVSYFYPLPSGASVVLTNLAAFIIAAVCGKIRRTLK